MPIILVDETSGNMAAAIIPVRTPVRCRHYRISLVIKITHTVLCSYGTVDSIVEISTDIRHSGFPIIGFRRISTRWIQICKLRINSSWKFSAQHTRFYTTAVVPVEKCLLMYRLSPRNAKIFTLKSQSSPSQFTLHLQQL